MISLDNDQRREVVNTRQRFAAWLAARKRADGYAGSLVWHNVRGEDHLVRSTYDGSGARRQRSQGKRDPQTEAAKSAWDEGRAEARTRLSEAQAVLDRQAAINRVLGLGRVPDLTARVLRAVDEAGLLGRGLRVLGTNAIFAYEAASGVMVDASLATTEDVDLLFDSRRSLKLATTEEVPEGSLLGLLRRVDRSFERGQAPFQAVNRDGFLVDLIKPMRMPPWRSDRDSIGADDLEAVSIAGLAWHENAPSFTATAIDEKGRPLRMVASDPRVFAAHKLLLSKRPDREPVKRGRDLAQAEAVARMVTTHLLHLPYRAEDLRMMPLAVFEAARSLFEDGA